jgi:hypothetical protein
MNMLICRGFEHRRTTVDAEHRANVYWPSITNVAEKLMGVGYLTGEEVEEMVFGCEVFEEETR